MLIAVWQSLKTLIKPISFRVFLVFMYLNVYVSYLCLSTSHFFSIILHSIVFLFCSSFYLNNYFFFSYFVLTVLTTPNLLN